MNTKATIIRHKIIGTGFVVVTTLLSANSFDAVVQYYITVNDKTILEYESTWSTEQKAVDIFNSIDN